MAQPSSVELLGPEALATCKECVQQNVSLLFNKIRGSVVSQALPRFVTWNHEHLLVCKHCSVCKFIVAVVGPDPVSSINLDQDHAAWRNPSHMGKPHLKLTWSKTDGHQFLSATFVYRGTSKGGKRIIQSYANLREAAAWLASSTSAKSDALSDTFASETSAIPIRAIDCQDRKLVSGHTGLIYACLSYVWGNADIQKLSTTNIRRYETENGLGEAATLGARTIENAIVVTRGLGLQYLWVDAFCIIQDDAEDLSATLPRMSQIYQQARVTIIADTAHANTGIPGISTPRNRYIYEADGHSFMALPGKLSHGLKTSVWYRRAWTLQEMWLSRRLLIFTVDQLFFQETLTIQAEDGTQDTQAQLQAPRLITMSEMLDKQSRSEPLGTLATWNRVKLRYVYQELVESYAVRCLTYPNDILRAFEGVLSFLEPDLGPHIWGVPFHILADALIWSCGKPSPRRTGFPSWSWCGWRFDLSGPTDIGFWKWASHTQSALFFAEAHPSSHDARFPGLRCLPVWQEDVPTYHQAKATPRLDDDASTKPPYSVNESNLSNLPPDDTNLFMVLVIVTKYRVANIEFPVDGTGTHSASPDARKFTPYRLQWSSFDRSFRGQTLPFTFIEVARAEEYVCVMIVVRLTERYWERAHACTVHRVDWDALTEREMTVFRVR